jgi:hypothetical protein
MSFLVGVNLHKSGKLKYILVFLLFCVSLLITSPAFALVCRNYDGEKICILSIKRSANKYWEYRAAVSINGVKRPVEIYNCRGKFQVQKDGKTVQFTKNSPGEMICSFFRDRRYVPPTL